MSPSPRAHVAAVAFPFSTHAAPLLAAVRRMAAWSPGAAFSFFSTAESNASVFARGGGGGGIKAYDVWDGVAEGYAFSGRPQERIELFLEAAPASLRASVAVAEAEAGRPVTCLVTDAFYWFGADMAAQMGVPWVAFWTAGPASLTAHLHTDLLRRRIGGATTKEDSEEKEEEEDQCLSFIPGMSKMTVEDLPEGVVSGNLDSIFSKMLHQMGLTLPQATAVFVNSFADLNRTITDDLTSKLSQFLEVGPFNLASSPPPSNGGSVQWQNQKIIEVYSPREWLDKLAAASAVYVSFGSITLPPPAELAGVADALERSGAPFIWSLGDNGKAMLPKGFLDRTGDRGLVVPWAPQAEILRHVAVGAFVTHCGWNSVLESISAGVPMICRPFFGDQRLNRRMVESVWEIGLGLEGGIFTGDELERCLDLVLRRKEGERMRDRAASLGRLATQAVGPAGSSTRNFHVLQHIVTKTHAMAFTKQ